MAKVYIFGHPFLTYDASPRDKHWTALTSEIKKTFGTKTFTDPTEVINILLFAYSYLVDRFRQVIIQETEFPFFLVTFLLHEQSIKIFRKSLEYNTLGEVSETEFSVNRRILKLILEQGCTQDLVWGTKPTNETILVYESKSKS